MAPRIILKSGVTAEWGTGGIDGGAAYGIVTDCDHGIDGEQEPLPDANGETAGLALFDDRDEVEVSFLAKSDASMPARGDPITIAGVTAALFMSGRKVWEARGWKKLRFTLRKWTAMG